MGTASDDNDTIGAFLSLACGSYAADRGYIVLPPTTVRTTLMSLIHVMRISFEHDEVGQFSLGDRSFDRFFGRAVRAVDGGNPERLVHRDLLVWPPFAPAVVAPRHHALNGHQWLEGAGAVVGRAGHANAAIQERAMSEHRLQLLGSVVLPFLTVVINVGPERRGDTARRLDPLEQPGIDQRAVLDAVPPVRVGPLLERPLVGTEYHVDRHVAVGVDANLEIVPMAIFHRLIDLLLGHREDAVVVGADIRSAHAHGALRRRAVGRVLEAAHLDPFIAEPVYTPAVFNALMVSWPRIIMYARWRSRPAR
jgi:hypothetical protein